MFCFEQGDGVLFARPSHATFVASTCASGVQDLVRAWESEFDGRPTNSRIVGLATIVLGARTRNEAVDLAFFAREANGVRLLVVGQVSVSVEADGERAVYDATETSTWLETFIRAKRWDVRSGRVDGQWNLVEGIVPCSTFSWSDVESQRLPDCKTDQGLAAAGTLVSDATAAEESDHKGSEGMDDSSIDAPTDSRSTGSTAPNAEPAESTVNTALEPPLDAVTSADSGSTTSFADEDSDETIWPMRGRVSFRQEHLETQRVAESEATIVEPDLLEELLVNVSEQPTATTFRVGEPVGIIDAPDWATPGPTPMPAAAPGQLPNPEHPSDLHQDDSEMTVLKGEMEYFRRPLVAAVGRSAAPESTVGMYCSSGHFTDPALASCLFCGGPLDWDRGPADGVRPVLGSTVLNSDDPVPLSDPLVIGRSTPKLTGAKEGERFVSVADDLMISRRHVEFRVENWDVVAVDLQSANGTSVETPEGRVIQLRPNIPHVLVDGAVILIGRQRVTFRGVEASG